MGGFATIGWVCVGSLTAACQMIVYSWHGVFNWTTPPLVDSLASIGHHNEIKHPVYPYSTGYTDYILVSVPYLWTDLSGLPYLTSSQSRLFFFSLITSVSSGGRSTQIVSSKTIQWENAPMQEKVL